MHFIILLGDLIEAPLHINDFLLEAIQNNLFDVSYCPHLILNMGLYFFYTLSYLIVALVHWEYLMELMLVLTENAIGAEEPILSLAENRNNTVVLEASDGIVRPD